MKLAIRNIIKNRLSNPEHLLMHQRVQEYRKIQDYRKKIREKKILKNQQKIKMEKSLTKL